MRSTLLTLLYLWLAANLWLAATRGVPALVNAGESPWGESLAASAEELPATLRDRKLEDRIVHFVSRRTGQLAPLVKFEAYPATVIEIPRKGMQRAEIIALTRELGGNFALWHLSQGGWRLQEISQ